MSKYFSEIIKSGKGNASPARDAIDLIPEEQDLAEALLEIADKYGKFNEDDTGIWAGYTPAEENEVASIGVKCGNCVLYRGGSECAIISAEVESEGKCRFAIIPDGVVKVEDKTVEKIFSKPAYLAQDELKEKIKDLGDNYTEEYLDISDLVPTQDYLDEDKFKDASSITKPITVYQDDEGYKLVDGHHRCASKVMSGHTQIMAKVYKGSVTAAAWFTSTLISSDDMELATDDPCWEGYKQIGMKMKDGKKVPNCVPIDASATEFAVSEDSCPPATRDIVLNVNNRQNAIDNVGYGPLNPNEPNDEFWQEKADRWKTTPEESKKSICGNCVFFVRTPSMLDCIEGGLAEGGSGEQNAWDAIDKAELGYCEALDFKCAASRTCNAWAAGGPITEEKAKVASGGPGAIAPVLKQGDIKKPSKGPELKPAMPNTKKIRYSRNTELALRKKLVEHNAKADETSLANLDMFKAVYRRGAGAFAASGRPDQERHEWAMSRVAAFSYLLKAGEPTNSNYTLDNDLLPTIHPKSSMSADSITASGTYSYDDELSVFILPEEEYETQEHAVFSLAEYSGLGYETIPAIRAAWIRGIKNNENPFERASVLASALYDSPDADLLPKKGTL
jgi:hypothetical protein